jgi:uncharacterized protein YggT (Ycf19 family)
MVNLIHLLANAYVVGLIFYGISASFNGDTLFRIRMFLAKYYEPILQKIRNQIIQFGWAPQIDLAPLVLFLIIWFCKSILVSFFMIPNG